MRSLGIVRKVDELGRIVLPVEICRMLDISDRDELEIFLDDDKVVLKKNEASCVFCGTSRELTAYRGKHICKGCTRELGR